MSRHRLLIVTIFFMLAGLFRPDVILSRDDLVCRRCHCGINDEDKETLWPSARIIPQAQISLCPGLDAVASEIGLTRVRFHRLDILLQNRANRDDEIASYRFEFEELVWRRRMLMDRRPESVSDFKRDAFILRCQLDQKIFRPLLKRDMIRRKWWTAPAVATAMVVTTFLWLRRRRLRRFHQVEKKTFIENPSERSFS